MTGDMSKEDNCPLLSLPDELLCHIFSLITDIPLKLMMESVCKRFQLISSTQSRSWNGNDTLDMNFNCTCSTIRRSVIKFKTNLSKLSGNERQIIYLNGLKVCPKKWPQAISQFLKRAKVRNLCLHIGTGQTLDLDEAGEIVVIGDDLNFLQQSVAIILKHPSQMKLKYIEFHRGFGLDYKAADELFLWELERSHKSLESIVLAFEESFPKTEGIPDPLWTQIFTNIQKCPKLTSFTISPSVFFPLTKVKEALEGKPLTSLSIGGNIEIFESEDNDYETEPIEQAVLAICQGSSAVPGLRSLKLDCQKDPSLRWLHLTNFSNMLDSRTRESLEEIMVDHGEYYEPFINYYIPHFDALPFLYPNLKVLHLIFHANNGKLNEDLLFTSCFFASCNLSPNVDRKVLLTCVTVDNEEEFKGRLISACEAAGIETIFAEKSTEADMDAMFSEKKESWAILRNGHGTIELVEVEELSSVYTGMSDFEDEFEIDDIEYEEDMEDWEDEEVGDYEDYELDED